MPAMHLFVGELRVKVTAERIPESQAVLNIEVEPERVEKYTDRAYRKLVNRVNIPGFRRGKAPRYIVERMLGKEALFHEGVEMMFPEVFKDAVTEAGLTPFDTPEWEIAEEEPLTLRVTVPLQPTVQLGNYKDVRLTRENVEVTDEEVDSILERLRDQQGNWVPVERKAEMGDRVVIDIDGAIKEQPLLESAGGESLIAQKGEQLIEREGVEYPVKEQPDSLLPGFAEQLVGMGAGDEKDFTITLPADYPEEKFAGKDAIFHVVCHTVNEQRRPELDDEFAKTVGDFETFEDLKKTIREDLLSQKKAEAEKRFIDTLIGMVVDRSTVEMPPSLVEHELDHAVERLSDRLKESGIPLDRYLAISNKSREQLREELRDDAKRRLSSALVLAEVAKAENIQISPEEIDAEINRATESLAEEEAAKVRPAFNTPEARNRISYDLWDRKVVDRLVEIATGEAEPESTSPTEDKGEEPAFEEKATE